MFKVIFNWWTTIMLFRFLFAVIFLHVVHADNSTCPESSQIRPCLCKEKDRAGLNVTCANAQADEVLQIMANLNKTLKVDDLILENIALFNLPSQLLVGLKLELLQVHHCNLSSIEAAAFADTAHALEELDFSHNSFERVPSQAFENLSVLNRMYLDFNRLTVLHAYSFKGLQSLSFLSLRGNSIQFIDCWAFVGIGSRFEQLWLDRNELTAIPSGSLRNLSSLGKLGLQENKITAIRPEEFSIGGDHLTYLYLANNQIAELPSRAFMSLKNLHFLDLSVNEIKSVHPFAFQGIEEGLYDLQLSNNRLNEVPASSLKNLTRLRSITLSYNSIKEVRKDDFVTSGKNLRSIHLEKNLLTLVDPLAFVTLDSLQFLYLESNQLSSAPYETYAPVLGKLSRFYIHDNPFHCDCRISWLRDWMHGNKSAVIGSAHEVKCSCPVDYKDVPLQQIPREGLSCPDSTSDPVKECESITVTESHSGRFSSDALVTLLLISFSCLGHDLFRSRIF